jgi:hypothetical protein
MQSHHPPRLLKEINLLALSFFLFIAGANAQQQGKGAQAVLAQAEALQLTPDQTKEVQEILSKTVAEFQQFARAKRGRGGLSKDMDGIRQKGQDKALAVLTAEQRKIWKNLALGSAPPGTGGGGSASAPKKTAPSLLIPSIDEMKNPPRPGAFGPSTQITKTAAHAPLGEQYVIVTDYRDPQAADALKRLAEHRGGTMIRVASLGQLHESPSKCVELGDQLRALKPRYVAIAPRMESYRENLHLCMLKLLSGLDDDPELDAFPGYLMADDPEGLAALIDRTIRFQPLEKSRIKPASIGAIEDTDARRYRSYQKAMVVQKMFAGKSIDSPAIIITTRRSHTLRDDFPKPESREGNVVMLPTSERHTFNSLSDEAVATLKTNNILYMFGHGSTERICGTSVSAFGEVDFTDELVFCGSCMSATPLKSDRPKARAVGDDKRFASYAINNGAVMMLGHMGLCGGFPKVYPMSELVMQGLSTGEAYQRLMNALIAGKAIPDYYSTNRARQAGGRDPANSLLYVLWGDPALVPILP